MLRRSSALCRSCFSRALRRSLTTEAPQTSTAEVPTRREPPPNESLDQMRARLLYQSKKRGILENDIIIGGFAEEMLPTLNRRELDDYDRLINGEHMEWDLFHYVSGKKAPPTEVEENSAFLRILAYVQSKKRLERH